MNQSFLDEETCCQKNIIHEDAVAKAMERQLNKEIIERAAAFFKLLGDPTRLSIVTLLREGELCVCDIAYSLNMTQSAISHQLKALTGQNITKKRKVGKVVYYALHDRHVEDIIEQAITHMIKG
ncbi:MAG: ArsR/SmtB family transcription factor [Bacilli bacterium]